MCTDADKGNDSFLIIELSRMQTANNSNTEAIMDLLADGG
jgi:hypothetical protein